MVEVGFVRAAGALAALVSLLDAPLSMASHAQFDHLVVAIRSLDEGIAEFARLTGVTAMRGGKHPGRGTENALISFGDRKYLEIIAPQPGATLAPRDQPMLTLDRLRILTWAVSVADPAPAAAALRAADLETTPVEPGARVTPAGERLEWSTFGVADRSLGGAPFFIAWSASTRHPSTTAPGGCTLARLIVRDPTPDRLSRALTGLGVDGIAFETGPAGVEARLACGERTVTLTSAR